ncbi:MAG: GtrA family protein [Oscillospiraceae bacterium]|jgi:putative flippase GtrA|nr:GtrA family protein [Oscillospiraceae bacterium]
MPKHVATPEMDAQDRFLAKFPVFKAFTDKHPEIYKLIKFFVAGGISNVPEILVYLLFLNVVFVSLKGTPLPDIGFFAFVSRFVTFKDGIADMYAYMISTAVGYTVAFILNRKISFKADANIALSTFLYVLMVIFTIGANGIIGPAITAAVGKLGMPAVLTQIIGKFLAMAVPGLWTYPLNRFIIHRHKKPEKAWADGEYVDS